MKTYQVECKARPERGMWRGGKFWPASGATAEVTETELAQLRTEPLILVGMVEEVLEVPKQEPAKPEPQKQEPAKPDGKSEKK